MKTAQSTNTGGASLYPMERGLLVAFEGIDGSGITTQARRARNEVFETEPALRNNIHSDEPVSVLTKEPTSGPIGGEISEVLSGRLEADPETLALMFAADRKDHSEQEIAPLIERGKIVVVDRYILSSLAYQGLEIRDLDWLYEINSRCIMPDLTILLDVSADKAKSRIDEDRLTVEIYEDEEQLERVHNSYADAKKYLTNKGHDIRVVDGEPSPNKVQRQVEREIKRKLDEIGIR